MVLFMGKTIEEMVQELDAKMSNTIDKMTETYERLRKIKPDHKDYLGLKLQFNQLAATIKDTNKRREVLETISKNCGVN